jgi:hypothetical protein
MTRTYGEYLYEPARSRTCSVGPELGETRPNQTEQVRGGPGSEPDPRGPELTGSRDMFKSDGAEAPHMAGLGRSRTRS